MSRVVCYDSDGNEFYPFQDWEQPQCKEEHKLTNGEYIRQMSDEQLAQYLFDRGNCQEYCYGICAYQDECDGGWQEDEFCIKQIITWLNTEMKEGNF